MFHSSHRAARALRALAVPCLLAALLVAGAGPAAAQSASCSTWSGAQPPGPATGNDDNVLAGVATLSPCNAWAVGRFSAGGPGHTLIEHWNGTAWKVVPSPDPGSAGNALSGVSVRGTGSAWAAGTVFSGGTTQALILRWNGRGWARAAAPHPDPRAPWPR